MFAGRRQPISVSGARLVNIEPPPAGRAAPAVIRPGAEGIELVAWAASNLALLERLLVVHGGLLFRGFQVTGVAHFEQFIKAMAGELLEYTYRSTPRTRIGGQVYTSTEYPADQFIPLHNENSYANSWPMKIWFYCEQPAACGGETPLADSRKVLRRLDPDIREQFTRKQIMYVRNYSEALDLPWQTVFQTTNKAAVEAYCRRAQLAFQWRAGERLRTQQICPAVAVHPRTGERVWFNQAHLFHPSSLPREALDSLRANYRADEFPRHACYGDGSPIDEAVLAEIRACYQAEAAIFGWQQHDVLLLDNMLMAHGRTPFSGPRRVLVGMAEPHPPQPA